jgi:hypothetical protein
MRKDLMKKRNNSVIAHGMDSVSRDDVEDCMSLARRILTELVPASEKMIEDYPFTSEKIKELVDILLV